MPRYSFSSDKDSIGILQDVQSKLEAALNEKNTKVISISGPWGSGKTHSVDKTLQEISENRDLRIARASLFGVKTLSELKLSLLDSIAASAGGGRAWIQKNLGWASNDLPAILSKVHTLGPLANEMVILWSTRALAGHLIVLDDIERKHSHLEMGELSGFIENFKINHGSRFILIMNDEKLSDASSWREVHEKIVDRPINLRPRPIDSLAVALSTESELRSALLPLIDGCRITNIRVINRIIAEAKRGLPEDVSAASATAQLFLAPLVFMLGTHLRARPEKSAGEASFGFDADNELVIDAGSEKLADNLGISFKHPLSECVIELIHSGALPYTRTRELLSREFSREDQHALSRKIKEISHDFYWEPDSDESSVYALAETVALSAAKHLNHELVSEALVMLEHIGSPPETLTKVLLAYSVTIRSATDKSSGRISKHNASGLHQKLLPCLQDAGLVDQTPEEGTINFANDAELNKMFILAGFGYSGATEEQNQAWFLAQLEKLAPHEVREIVIDLLDQGGRPSLPDDQLGYARAFSAACRDFARSTPNQRLARMVDFALEGNRPMRQRL